MKAHTTLKPVGLPARTGLRAGSRKDPPYVDPVIECRFPATAQRNPQTGKLQCLTWEEYACLTGSTDFCEQ
jgi:hypothetical protein